MRWGWGFVLDVVCVLVFVGIGRGSHDEGGSVLGFLGVSWPFVVGVGVGWVVCRGWRRAVALVPTGVVVWVLTVAVGMGLRALVGQGTAVAFVVVAGLFLGGVMLGWRVLARVVGVR
ncbi:DUF3054 domain-containing protein [Actinomadura meridiana]|uniref:DUF3054 domain-containing protein n=1 Tax=Actinomadura meridiana TaxID=559626 RepID=UPI0031E735B4